ncbi:MAG: extracellular solute-binding protein [Betaproteobacteria bacterium]
MFSARIFLTAGLLLSAVSVFAAAPRHAVVAKPVLPAVIELSHRLDEVRAERLEPLIELFNSQHKEVVVKLVRRVEGEAPKQLSLVTREEHARFMNNKAKFRPLFEVMKEAKEPFDAGRLSPEVKESLVDGKGQLIALPVAFSTPVLYINKAAFRKAGMDPEVPPRTWLEMQEMAGKLVESGVRCPYTTSWPTWVFIDNMSAWSGADLSDAKGKLAFNGLAQVKHIAMMASWHKAKYFHTFGSADEADRRFALGECAMLTSSSSLFPSLAENKTVDAGVSSLPYHDDVYGAPKNTLADGSSLWVASGLKSPETKGVAKFISYILGPEVQIKLTLAGGFLPITPVARAAASSTLLKADLAGLQVAFSQLRGKHDPMLVRPAQIEMVRNILNEELEAVWANRKPAKEALDEAVRRGNALMRPVAPVLTKAKRAS